MEYPCFCLNPRALALSNLDGLWALWQTGSCLYSQHLTLMTNLRTSDCFFLQSSCKFISSRDQLPILYLVTPQERPGEISTRKHVRREVAHSVAFLIGPGAPLLALRRTCVLSTRRTSGSLSRAASAQWRAYRTLMQLRSSMASPRRLAMLSSPLRRAMRGS